MVQHSVNPLPDVLKIIPEVETILDYKLMDDIRFILMPTMTDFVSNSVICLLLTHLNKSGLVKITILSIPDIAGEIITIKKEPNGNLKEQSSGSVS